MELRVLQYFLAVAREQSISAAAQSLHLSQPTLSTQLKAMEAELGKQLLIRGARGSRKVTLTEEGMILRKRAEEILQLVKKAEDDFSIFGCHTDKSCNPHLENSPEASGENCGRDSYDIAAADTGSYGGAQSLKG